MKSVVFFPWLLHIDFQEGILKKASWILVEHIQEVTLILNLYIVENPESLIRRRRGKKQVGISQIERSSSQTQEKFLSFHYFKLETKFEQYFLRSKSESKLK